MAEVTTPVGVGRQLALVIGLRWRIFRNSLRSQSEKIHILGTAAMGIFYAALTVGGSIGHLFWRV